MAASTAHRHRDLILFALLSVAAALRLRGLSRESLWLDEINQLMTAAHPLSQMRPEIRWHASPPLDYVVMHLWQLLAWSDTSIRLPAVMWSVASVALLYLAVRQLGYENAAAGAAALLTFSLPSIAYAQEARMYSLFVFGTTALLYSMGRLLRDPESHRGWMLVAVSAMVSLYTHYYAALLLMSLAVSVLVICIARRSWRVLRLALLTGTVVALSFLPWLPTLLEQARIHQGTLQYSLPREEYFETIPSYLSSGLEGGWVWCLCGIFVFGLIVVTFRSWERGATLAAFSIVPFFLAVEIPFFSSTITPRNLLFLLPGYYIGIAVGLSVTVGTVLGWLGAHRESSQGSDTSADGRSTVQEVASLIAVLIVAVWPTYDMLGSYHRTGWWMKTPNTDWRGTAAYLDAAATPRDVIITNNRYTRYLLSFYLDPNALRRESLDPYVQDPRHTAPADDERFRVLTLEAPPALLRRAVQEAGSVWFVVPAPPFETLLGVTGRLREQTNRGVDPPVGHIEGPRTTSSLVLSFPPGDPSPTATAGGLNLVTREGWSSQFFLQDGVFLRWMGPQGVLRVPIWSTLRTTLRLRLFAPPELAGAMVQLRAGDQAIASHTLVPGWQELALDVAPLPNENGWVAVHLIIDPAPSAPADSMKIGDTGTASPVPILAESSTHEAARFADIFIDGQLYSWFAAAKGYARGYNLVAVDPRTGDVVDWAVFDTHGDPNAAAAMAAFVDALADGTIVAGAVKDEGSTRLSPAGHRALEELGCSLDVRGRFRAAHAFVGVKGAPPGSAIEDGLGFQGRVAVGADARDFSIGLSSAEISVAR